MHAFSDFNESIGPLFSSVLVGRVFSHGVSGGELDEPFFSSLDDLRIKYASSGMPLTVDAYDLDTLTWAIHVYETLVTNVWPLFSPDMFRYWQGEVHPLAKPFHDNAAVKQLFDRIDYLPDEIKKDLFNDVLHAFYASLTIFSALIASIPGSKLFVTTLLNDDSFVPESLAKQKDYRVHWVVSIFRPQDKTPRIHMSHILGEFTHDFAQGPGKQTKFSSMLTASAKASIAEAKKEYHDSVQGVQLPIVEAVKVICDKSAASQGSYSRKITPRQNNQFGKALKYLNSLFIVFKSSLMAFTPIQKKIIDGGLAQLTTANDYFVNGESINAWNALIKVVSGFNLIAHSLPQDFLAFYRLNYNEQGNPMVRAKPF